VLDLTKIADWRWIPTKMNVADDATKWRDTPIIPDRWFAGPGFLQLPESEWPVERNKITTTDEEESPIQYHLHHHQHENLFDPDRFSNWTRLLRTVSFVGRFIRNLQARTRTPVNRKPSKLSNDLTNMTELNGDELNHARKLLIKQCQLDSFGLEISQLKESKTINPSNKIYNLHPILDDDGVLR
jgi:hypothetical protein